MEFDVNGPNGTVRIVIAILLGLGLIGYGVYSYTAQASALDSAESVPATIVSTSVETLAERHGADFSP